MGKKKLIEKKSKKAVNPVDAFRKRQKAKEKQKVSTNIIFP